MHVKTAKELRQMDLEDVDEDLYSHLDSIGMLYEYFPEATGSYDNDMSRIDAIERFREEQSNNQLGTMFKSDQELGVSATRRIDNIGQNGNDGLHYRVSGSDSPEAPEWPHKFDTGYAEKIEALYKPEPEEIFGKSIHMEIKGNETEDIVNNPSHYELGNTGMEAIDVIEATLTKEQYIGYLRGNILKYQLRANKKNGNEDLRKADVYSGWLLEALEE